MDDRTVYPADHIGGEPPERLRKNRVIVGATLLGPGALVLLFAGLEWIVVVAPLTLIPMTVFLGVRNGHLWAAAAAVLSPFVFVGLVLLGLPQECGALGGPSCPTIGLIVRGVVGATLVGGSALVVASRPRRASATPEGARED